MMLTALRTISTRLAVAAALLAGGAVGAGALLAQPAAGAEGGVNVNSIAAPSVAAASALGPHWLRMFVVWKDVEPARGAHDAGWLEKYDSALSSLPKGTKAILDFVGAPPWESGSGASNAPPRSPADYAAALHFLAQRWAGRVGAYEIWNEEDASAWWAGGPDPGSYTRVLQSAYTAVKSADPSAAVVLGGLTGNDYGFLQGVYEAGGKGYFDAVGVHTDTACNVASPYEFLREANGRLFQNSFLAYREVHATELANGDEKPIWMTELSWRTTSATCPEGAWAGQKPEGVTESQQATYLAQAYHCLAGDPYVQVALWYPLIDEGAVVSGLMRANGSHKPAYAAMSSYLKSGDQLGEPCGDFAGPQITLYRPTNGLRYTGYLKIKVKASDAQGIRRIRVFYDGHLIRNWVPYLFTHTYPRVSMAEMLWFGARKLAVGRHVLTIVAIDKLQNSSSAHLTIVHRREGGGRRGRRHH
ncbi:MAG TPA: Ig-like domain-containing protein [Solirubrobacteraceae bacterium]|jgi:hypothetical protein